ncbi:hypothetical protein [Cryptosporangium sp. NPDC048952]|uniref:hypothetical protein n=1 Tax=Cryptosporangium sp. NPDC048952 TaxID=3363961 RepID=UPI003718534D
MGACLRMDAVYCAVAAVILVVFAGPVGGTLGVPVAVPLVAAAVTLVWAGLLVVLSVVQRLRAAVRFVMVVNVVAVAALSGLAFSRPVDALSLLVLAVAVEVGAFAVWQTLLLRSVRLH